MYAALASLKARRTGHSGMKYTVRFISDEQMPAGHQWAICRLADRTTLYLRESARDLPSDEAAAILAEAWAGYRELTGAS